MPEPKRTNSLVFNEAMLNGFINGTYLDEIRALTMNPEDIAKIQLQIEAEGPPIIFTADKGSIDFGRVPFVLNHPLLTPLIRDIEARIEELSEMGQGQEFYTKTIELTRAEP